VLEHDPRAPARQRQGPSVGARQPLAHQVEQRQRGVDRGHAHPEHDHHPAEHEDGGAGNVGERRQRRALGSRERRRRDRPGDGDGEQHVHHDRGQLGGCDPAQQIAAAGLAGEHDAGAVAD
jgi:hypothetical protein